MFEKLRGDTPDAFNHEIVNTVQNYEWLYSPKIGEQFQRRYLM